VSDSKNGTQADENRAQLGEGNRDTAMTSARNSVFSNRTSLTAATSIGGLIAGSELQTAA